MSAARALLWLLAAAAVLIGLGIAIGSSGWSPPWAGGDGGGNALILWEIRLPRSLGAWAAGALLGLGGAIAQGLFRNPLADPYLLGSASGASLAVAVALAVFGVGAAPAHWLAQFGLTGAAFIGSLAAVLLTLAMAKGMQQGLRLLLAGVVVGVVLGAVKELILLATPQIMRSMQSFMLGTTGFIGWSGVGTMLAVLAVCLFGSLAGRRALDALALGESTARSLGVQLGLARSLLVATMALATAAAVAQAGLIAFVGLVAPHLVRSLGFGSHGGLLLLSAAGGGVLLLAADVAARWVVAPQELPVGLITAVLGGGYLLWLMHTRPIGITR
ncbi:FecCD family ABC transporter permease [Piscinibacter sakaiensis]|uniref:FecCD family ABC transporter permease n=1 Tax=Piscinibacter sakaiensis TaxID=1547922 RepID=UPI003AAD377E